MDRTAAASSASDTEKGTDTDRENGQFKNKKDLEAAVDDDATIAAEEPVEPVPGEKPTTPADAAPAPGPGPIPDGGLDAWLQVAGSWVILINTWGLVNSFGVYQTFYETELLRSSSSSSISWIGSLQASLLMLVGVVSGPLYDAGYFRHLIISGLFLIVFGMFMTSLCKTYWQVVLAQGITIGLGMGLTFLPSATILAQYFSKRRALVLGISSAGSPLAGIIFPIIFSRLQPHIGFGWATRVIAFILLGLDVIPVAFMKTRIPPSGKIRSLVDTTALRDAPFMLVNAACFFSFLVLYVAFFYTQLFDIKYGLSSLDFAPYTVTMLNVGSVFGRLVPNFVADKLGSLNVLMVCAITSAIMLYGWMGVRDLGGLIVFALLYGLFSGGMVSVSPSVAISLSPDMGRMGARLGMLLAFSGISVLVGTPIGGAILGDYSRTRWLAVMGYAAGGLSLGFIIFCIARLLLYRRNGKLRA